MSDGEEFDFGDDDFDDDGDDLGAAMVRGEGPPDYDPLADNASEGLLGQRRDLVGTDQRAVLFTISREQNVFGTQPRLLAICVDVETAVPFGAGEVILEGVVHWSTGSGKGAARFDVSARGAVFTVVGADGMWLEIFRTGTNTSTIAVRGTVAIAVGGQAVPAQLTQRHAALPLPARARIPKYSREVTVQSSVSGGLLGVNIVYFADPAGALLTQVPADDGAQAIPGGAEFYAFTVAAPAQSVRAIFGLRLA